MRTPMGLDSAVEFIKSQSHPPRREPGAVPIHRPTITISRQAGTGAHVLAAELVARLQPRAPRRSPPWTAFDRELVDKVLEDHDLPRRLAAYMPEDRVSEISDLMDELFGLHPPSWLLVRKTADTILHLAELGHVIVIGRGANVVTARLEHAFHVRLVGSLEARIEREREYRGLDPDAAAAYVHEQDLRRKRYLKKYYGKDIDDPLLYDLVINVDRVPHEEAARIVAEAVAPTPAELEPVGGRRGEHPGGAPPPRHLSATAR